MKKIIPILLILFLVGCTSTAYKENLALGKEELEAGNYSEAIDAFTKAKEEKATDEVKQLLRVSKNLNKSQQAFEQGDFEKSIEYAEKVTALESDSTTIKKAIKLAKVIIKDSEAIMADMAAIQESMQDGKALLDQGKYGEAYDVFNSVVTMDIAVEHKAITELINQTIDLKNEALEMKEASNDNSDADNETGSSTENEENSGSESDTNNDSKTDVNADGDTETNSETETNSNSNSNTDSNSSNETGSDNGEITQSKAEKIVKDHLGITGDDSNLKVEFGYKDNGNYVFQVFETVVDNPDTGEGHTATWGWYGVNKSTGKVFNALE